MNKTGRNDPCPCGSGKKYKKCHLAEDECAAAAAPLAAGMALEEAPEYVDTDFEDALLGPEHEEDEIDAELDRLLHEVDFSGMVRLLTAYIPKAELENADFAEGFFGRVWDATETVKDRDAYRELLRQLGRENPDLFAEIAGLLVWDILEQTVADGRHDSLGRLFVALSVVASRDIILFMNLADGMAYFGLLESLVEGMRKGWRYVRDSKLLSPASVQRYARRAINYEVFSVVEKSESTDIAGLGARIRNFEAWEDWEIEKCHELMSSNRFEALRKEDFSASPEARRLNPELQNSFREKLNTLAHVFRGFLRKEKGVSWPQADLAAAEILELLSGEWEFPFPEDPDEEGTLEDGKDMLIRNLCPDAEILDGYFVEKLYEMDMQEFRACALWTNLSHWLDLLERLGLVDHAVSRDVWASWEPFLETVGGEFGDFPAPPSATLSVPPAKTAF